jgi:hypothetical protein
MKKCQPIVRYLPFILPLLWGPLVIEYIISWLIPWILERYFDQILAFDLLFIFLVRFFVLDLILYFVTRHQQTSRLGLFEIVFLYLEITLITITYFGLLYNLLGIDSFFYFTGGLPATRLSAIEQHPLFLAMYVSLQNFTMLGLGDWMPQTLSGMIAVMVEAILGFIQAGVFVAIVVTAHEALRNSKRI